ncbi:MAG: HlyD family efflux transporter periplasmic adaptor subunit, partial [Alphaproteobacteria bacterium]|nr:HlyD family efflux transporter periplasmic adaptor subunit [Alphaproteobacteria bacterium]
MAAAASQAGALPPLREEIGIFPGPTALDGSPTWTLHDPIVNRFFRLGWPEFEIISRWRAATVDVVVERVNRETTLEIESDDVEQLRRFLFSSDLLRVSSPQATAYLVGKAQRLRHGIGKWLLHNYLFMRIPLARPDRFLTATYPYVRGLFSRGVALAILLIGIVGLYLVARQWDVFLDTFVDMFTLQGAVAFAITLGFLKIVHELGHAYTAKRFGCRVPTMGVALLVMVPVLYTDVNESWKLTARRQRLAIGIAGVTAELCCAAIAMCAWGFLPNGAARSAAFLVATSTWITTVMINLSPFMRYDGYYVLSDFLETPNLHSRAFALARWWLRERLLALGDAPPEDLPLSRQRLLVFFAFLTWAYRFALFLGIAAVIYHFAIKALGVVMMAVEIGYFLVRPIAAEAVAWWRRRADMRWNVRSVLTLAGIAALLVLLVVPWRSTIEAPAVLKSRDHVDVFAPEFGARIATIAATDGQGVQKGTLLFGLVSPDLDYKIAHAHDEIGILEWQMNARGLDPELLARSQVTEREYEAALAEYRGLLSQKAQLEVKTPLAGKVVDLAENLEPGIWVAAKSRLASVIDPRTIKVEAYVDESDLERVSVGDAATFRSDADSRLEVPLTVVEIARASTRTLPDPYL